MIAGRLTREPEMKYTAKGTTVCEIGMAMNEKRKVNEEYVDKAVFVDVTLWGRTAELAAKYLVKGSQAFVEGKLDLDQWEDRETGKKRSKLKIVGMNIQFGARPDNPGPPRERASSQPSSGAGRRDNHQPQPSNQQQPAQYLEDDDIPF